MKNFDLDSGDGHSQIQDDRSQFQSLKLLNTSFNKAWL